MPSRLTAEEEALREIASTRVSRFTATFLVVSFIALLVGVPAVQELAFQRIGSRNLGHPLLHNAPMPPTPAQIRAYEDDLEEASFLRHYLLPPTQNLLCHLGAGNEEVYLGREGWLFYRFDVDHLTAAPFLDPAVLEARRRLGDETTAPPQPDPLAALTDFQAQLATRGIELLVVPTPVKPMLYPERLSKHYDPEDTPLTNPSLDEFLKRLASAGVATVDLAHAFAQAKRPEDPLYLRTDTHWTPTGLRIATETIASKVRECLTGQDLLRRHYERRAKLVANRGDIARMLQLPTDQTRFPLESVQVERVVDGEGNPWAPEPEAEILLLGDSFSNVYSLGGMGWGESAGLGEHLSAQLETPIDRIVRNDNGAFATRLELRRELAQGRDRLEEKKLVIYQFACRELSIGDWRFIDILEHPEETAPKPSSPPPTRITASIRAVAEMPRPGSVPYKNLITSLHLGDVRSEHEHLAGGVVVFLWGMRNNEWTPAARFRPGDSVALDIVPWDSVARIYGSYNRAELGSEDLWQLPSFWANPVRETPGEPPAAELESAIDDDSPGSRVHEGKDGWLFFRPELRHLTVGEFWGEAARRVSRASNPEWRDPVPAIIDFHEQLDGAGIELWMVPVPAKATIYANAVLERREGAAEDRPPREEPLRRFLEVLGHHGVRVVDLVPRFVAEADKGAMYCRQDTHWSPLACEVVAGLLAAEFRDRPWFRAVEQRTFERTERTIEIEGDLWRLLKDPNREQESVTLRVVFEIRGARRELPKDWRASPVLLLGDSHTLVFHVGGDLLASGAGLADQLAFELGFPVDVVGVRGSGSTASRLSLFRRRDNLAGKRVVIWVFAAREFTESVDGWRKIPLIR